MEEAVDGIFVVDSDEGFDALKAFYGGTVLRGPPAAPGWCGKAPGMALQPNLKRAAAVTKG